MAASFPAPHGPVPNARQAVMPDCWHLPPMEHPEAFNELLLSFLGGAAGRA